MKKELQRRVPPVCIFLVLMSAAACGGGRSSEASTPTDAPTNLPVMPSSTAPIITPEADRAQKQKGIAYAAWWPGIYSNPDAEMALRELADTGANWISITVTQYQEDLDSTDIAPSPATPTDNEIILAVSQAHDLGMHVLLKPTVDISTDEWRAYLGGNFTEAEWKTWFTSFRTFLVHYARLAQDHGVESLCLSAEMTSTEGRESDWRYLIDGIRRDYDGALTYGANWGEEGKIQWWDAVDYIGVDAYFPLTNTNHPTVEEMKSAWYPHLAELEALASQWGKRILFPEIGFRSIDGAARVPGDPNVIAAVDLQEQADAYQATLESVFDQDWFAGIYWWYWQPDPFQGGPCDGNYTPHDKPAEEILRQWYGQPRTKATTPQPDDRNGYPIFLDSLEAGWEDWSWDAQVDLFADTSAVRGNHAISIAAQPWGAIQLRALNAMDATEYHWLEFFLREASEKQNLGVFIIAGDEERRTRPVDDCRYTDQQPIAPNRWTRVRIPLEDLNAAAGAILGICIRNNGPEESVFWLDDIRLIGVLPEE
jgi:hypothetical protein